MKHHKALIFAAFTFFVGSAQGYSDKGLLDQVPDYSEEPKTYTSDEKNSLLDNAYAKDAERYGYIYQPSAFWHFSYSEDDFSKYDYRDVNSINRKSLLETIFNGDFSGQSTSREIAGYFKLLVGGYSKYCRATLGSSALPLTTTLTRTSSNSYGSYTETTGKFSTYVLPRYAALYQSVANKGSLGIYDLIEVNKHIKTLLSQQGCNSKINAQLMENLYRVLSGIPSIQHDRSINLTTKNPSDNYLYYNYFEGSPGIIEYIFTNSSNALIPPLPEDLLAITTRNFGNEDVSKKFSRSFPWKPTIIIKNSQAGYLKRMTIAYMISTGSDTLPNFKYMAMGLSSWDPVLENNKQLSDKVYSHFVKLAGKQQHRVVECIYEGGGYLVFWKDSKPEGAEPEDLRKVYRYHPLLAVQESRDRCPTTLSTGNLGKDYIFNTASVKKTSPSSLPPLSSFIVEGQDSTPQIPESVIVKVDMASDPDGCKEEKQKYDCTPLVEEVLKSLTELILTVHPDFEEKFSDTGSMEYKNFAKVFENDSQYLECYYQFPNKNKRSYDFLVDNLELDEEGEEFLYHRKVSAAIDRCPPYQKQATDIRHKYFWPIEERIDKRTREYRAKYTLEERVAIERAKRGVTKPVISKRVETRPVVKSESSSGPVKTGVTATSKISQSPRESSQQSIDVNKHAELNLISAREVPYPRRAKSKGISGFCSLSYTVNTSGRVENPVIKECQPKGVFERNAIKAIMSFRYSARIVGGIAVETKDVEHRFEFKQP